MSCPLPLVVAGDSTVPSCNLDRGGGEPPKGNPLKTHSFPPGLLSVLWVNLTASPLVLSGRLPHSRVGRMAGGCGEGQNPREPHNYGLSSITRAGNTSLAHPAETCLLCLIAQLDVSRGGE